MAKSKEKMKARKLRRAGKSIGEIATLLGISKGSSSLWCRDIILSKTQTEKLRRKMIIGSYAGRMKGAAMNKQRRLGRISFWKESAKQNIGKLTERDLMMVGIGLYLGEGSKKKRQFEFTNSNPELIQICIKWLNLLGVSPKDMHCRVFINEMHKDRMKKVTQDWAKITNLPLTNFKNPVLIKSRLQKRYENHNSYIGVLKLGVSRSSDLFYQILGLMNHFVYNTDNLPG